MSWRGIQHEVLGAGGGDDPRRQQDVDDGLQEEEDLWLLQVRAVCKKTERTKRTLTDLVLWF